MGWAGAVVCSTTVVVSVCNGRRRSGRDDRRFRNLEPREGCKIGPAFAGPALPSAGVAIDLVLGSRRGTAVELVARLHVAGVTRLGQRIEGRIVSELFSGGTGAYRLWAFVLVRPRVGSPQMLFFLLLAAAARGRRRPRSQSRAETARTMLSQATRSPSKYDWASTSRSGIVAEVVRVHAASTCETALVGAELAVIELPLSLVSAPVSADAGRRAADSERESSGENGASTWTRREPC